LLLRPDLIPLCVGQPRAAGREPACPHRISLEVNRHQFLRIVDWQHLEANGIDKLENRRVRANA